MALKNFIFCAIALSAAIAVLTYAQSGNENEAQLHTQIEKNQAQIEALNKRIEKLEARLGNVEVGLGDAHSRLEWKVQPLASQEK